MKRALVLGLLLACGSLAGCVAAVVGGTAQGSQATADAAITADVKARLNADPATRSLAISVDTREAVVTLTGTVRTASQRSTAESLARNARGVKSVRNQLKIN